MNRRRLLSTASGGAVACLAGCFDVEQNSDEGVDGHWELRALVVNGDDEPRERRLECRSEGRGSVTAAYSTLPAGGEHEVGPLGRLRDEEREVYVETDYGAVGKPWRPTECRHMFVEAAISGGEPPVEEGCREEEG